MASPSSGRHALLLDRLATFPLSRSTTGPAPPRAGSAFASARTKGYPSYPIRNPGCILVGCETSYIGKRVCGSTPESQAVPAHLECVAWKHVLWPQERGALRFSIRIHLGFDRVALPHLPQSHRRKREDGTRLAFSRPVAEVLTFQITRVRQKHKRLHGVLLEHS